KGYEISLPVAQETLRDILSSDDRTITIEMIQKTIADFYGMRVQDLKAKNNAMAVTGPRQICMYVCKKITGASLPQIGREFGNKHHTTVLHSINKVELMRQQDKEMNRQVQAFMDSFK